MAEGLPAPSRPFWAHTFRSRKSRCVCLAPSNCELGKRALPCKPCFAYTFSMASSAPPTPGASESRPALFTRLGNFWQRVSEGRRIDDLWSQFAADARSSYGFYGKDVDWDEVNQLPRWRRPL